MAFSAFVGWWALGGPWPLRLLGEPLQGPGSTARPTPSTLQVAQLDARGNATRVELPPQTETLVASKKPRQLWGHLQILKSRGIAP